MDRLVDPLRQRREHFRLRVWYSHLPVKLRFVVILEIPLMKRGRNLHICRDTILSIVDLVIGCLPIGSLRCGFCDLSFLTDRGRARRAPDTAGHGLDREMQRAPSRVPEPKRGHNRSVSGDDRKRMKRLQIHIQKWDRDQDYRMHWSRQGMIRGQYNTGVVLPWLAINATDEPPHQPIARIPLGIPAADVVTA